MAENKNIIKQLISNLNKRFNSDFGLQGAQFITTAATEFKGDWIAIKADGGGDVTFTTLTASKGDNLDTFTLKAGDVLYGPFTTINIASGGVLAYYRNRV